MPTFSTEYPEKSTPQNDDFVLLTDTSSLNAVKKTKVADLDAKTMSEVVGAMFWEELARFPSGNNNIASIAIPLRKYIRVIGCFRGNSSAAPGDVYLVFNNDTSTQYAFQRILVNGMSGTLTPVITAGQTTSGIYLGNVSTNETITLDFTLTYLGVGNYQLAGNGFCSSHYLQESINYLVARYSNTSTRVTSMQLVATSPTGLITQADSVVILGHN